MRWYYGFSLFVIVAAAAGFLYVQSRLSTPLVTDEHIEQMKIAASLEDESAFLMPASQPAVLSEANALNNVYFGDLHSHSNLSFDAYIFGTRMGVGESYQFAKGEPIESTVGERMQLSVPLDFAAVTDHAEGFGIHKQCGDPESGKAIRKLCKRMEAPNAKLFLELRKEGEQRPPVRATSGDVNDDAKAILFAQETWAEIVALAEQHNDPGRFTTFAAYEYSPPLPDSGKVHRNVIFRGSDVPGTAVSAFDAMTELDLWDQLEAGCHDPCEYMTIPHNPNKTWGVAFANHTLDGDLYTEDDWRLRARVEPLIEMFQIKGNSECSVGFGTSDEECNFEQFLSRCEPGQETGCIFPTSMARDGLKIGLELEDEIGVNPFAFGMIGSTDTHNANPGDTEEWDFRGMAGMMSATAVRRIRKGGAKGGRGTLLRNPGGLAAIWAPENTREALFDAMQRKEVYATSGTRIRLRFFASFGFERDMLDNPELLDMAYKEGVPMGSTLGRISEEVPEILVWAMQDPLSAPLDRVQIIKGWTENGETFETVQDVMCSGNRAIDPETKRCAEIISTVDLSNCAIDKSSGAAELKTIWTDPDYRSEQNAFYYARVIQTPTCRWSTYDSLRMGRVPPSGVPATSTEMAWSSPIWVK